jgi:uncharacterized membrane protein YeaQ/YmgE (transglycosylase-associated protein family)
MPGSVQRREWVTSASAAGAISIFQLGAGIAQPKAINSRVRKPARQGVSMSLFAWIILGLIAGFIASKIVNKTGEGVLLDIVLGIIGAVVGGLLFGIFGGMGVSGLNLHSLIVAVVGAIVVLWGYHAVRREV